jgi:hypothetical protein
MVLFFPASHKNETMKPLRENTLRNTLKWGNLVVQFLFFRRRRLDSYKQTTATDKERVSS